MAGAAVSKRTLAAAVIIQRLKQGRGKAESGALKAALHRHHLPDRYLGPGVRVIRDLYGDNVLVVIHRGPGESPIYALDPKKFGEARDWAKKMFKRALTETRHVIHVLDWSIAHGIAPSSAKRARHYARNVEVELDNVLSTL
jgi:hypothetical protein